MRKVIDIPDEIVKDLKKLAVDQDKDLKNFIQDELKKLVEKSQSKPS
jgi:mRNA-degrading endonuclease RelE of RelBE toxin-antitoxin system